MLDALTGTVPPPANWDSSLCFRLGVRVGWLDCSPFRPGTGFLIPCSHSCLLPADGLGPRDEKIRLFVYGARGLVSVHWTRKSKWRKPGARGPSSARFASPCHTSFSRRMSGSVQVRVDRILQDVGRHGIARTLYRAVSRASTRLVPYHRFDAMRVSASSSRDCSGTAIGAFEIRSLSRQEMLDLSCLDGVGMQRPYVEQAAQRDDDWLAVMIKGEAACVCWYAPTSPVTLYRLWNVNFGGGCVYVHGAYTLPAHRGKRLLERNLRAALARCARSGATALIAMVEFSNYPSLNAFRRAGYARIGTVRAARIGRGFFVRNNSACLNAGISLTRCFDEESAGSKQKSISGPA
jgi:GNAT superfamily N-acetyltransferase